MRTSQVARNVAPSLAIAALALAIIAASAIAFPKTWEQMMGQHRTEAIMPLPHLRPTIAPAMPVRKVVSVTVHDIVTKSALDKLGFGAELANDPCALPGDINGGSLPPDCD